MRELLIDIKRLSLKENDIINITLIDSTGKPFINNDMYSFNQDIIIATTTKIKVSTRPNNDFSITTYYRLTIKENEFLFLVPQSNTIIEKPLDVITLTMVGCYKSVIFYDANNHIVIDKLFLEKLNRFFVGNKVRFSMEEQSVLNLYIYFAENVFYGDSTNDFVREIDLYLGKIGIGE
jgi:hypothetical protein